MAAVKDLLQKTATSVSIEEAPETKFEPNNNKTLKILVNPKDIDGGFFYETIGTENLSIEQEKIKLVHKGIATFDVILVHELIHLKHFLEELNKIAENKPYKLPEARNLDFFSKIKYSLAIIMGPPYIKPDERRLFPELAAETALDSKNKRSNLWDSFEERRTVCGPDIDGITENAYRISKGLPIRYIYQGYTLKFFEPEQTIFDCTTSLVGEQLANFDLSEKINKSYIIFKFREKIPE